MEVREGRIALHVTAHFQMQSSSIRIVGRVAEDMGV